jgi:hypothetical protein
MQNMKVLLALGACFGAAVVAACSSSSSGNSGAPTDAGGGEDVTTADSGDDGSTTCLPLGGTGCAKGSACCLNLSGGIAALASGGMCVMPGTCQYSIEVACTQGSDCNSGQVCCATLGGAGDGGTLAELEEGGLAALGLDASALSLDAGGDAGLNFSFKTSCSSSCTGNQIQACATDQECLGGGSCVSITSLLGDGGSDSGAAGALSGGLGMYASALGSYMACVSPPSDAAALPDTGAADAVAPTDAPADALQE